MTGAGPAGSPRTSATKRSWPWPGRP